MDSDQRQSGRLKARGTTERRRVSGRACTECRKRKVRCDVGVVGSPCSHCVSRQQPDCHISVKQRHPPANRNPVLIQPRHNRPEELGHASSLASPESRHSQRKPDEPLNAPYAASESDNEARENEASNIAELLTSRELRNADVSRRNRLCYIGTEVSNFNYLIRQNSSSDDTHLHHFRTRQYRRRYTAHDLRRIPAEVLQRPERRIADELVRAYFANVNAGWPIVEEESFMAQYAGSDPQNPVSLPLLNAIFLVGAHSLTAHRQDTWKLQPVFFHRARTLMHHRFDQDRDVTVQVALLLTWYSDGLEEIVANAWHWIGMAARTALGMGMHRDVSRSKLLPEFKRTWVRLWWVLFQFDTIVSASYGRPQAINLDDCDVPELQPSHFDGIPNAEIDFVIHHTRLCMLISRTLRQRWSLRGTPESQSQATKAADDALAHFFVQLPPRMQLSLSSADIWQSTLHLTYNNFLLLLHRPPPQQHQQQQQQQQQRGVDPDVASPSICADAVMAMTSIYDSLLANNRLAGLWLYGVHALFTALVHASTQAASEQPIVAARAANMLESLRTALRELARHWRFAMGLMQVYEQPESGAGGSMRKRNPTPVSAGGYTPGPAHQQFILRPESVSYGGSANALSGSGVQETQEIPANTSFAPYGIIGDFAVSEGDVLFGDMPLADASVLDLFLAGMEGNGPDFGLSWT